MKNWKKTAIVVTGIGATVILLAYLVKGKEQLCLDYITQSECETAGCYWWSDGTCHSTPENGQKEVTIENITCYIQEDCQAYIEFTARNNTGVDHICWELTDMNGNTFHGSEYVGGQNTTEWMIIGGDYCDTGYWGTLRVGYGQIEDCVYTDQKNFNSS